MLALSDSLAKIGAAHNATAAQISIAWILSLAPDIIPLPGSKHLAYAEENFKAGEIVLNESEKKEIRALVQDAERKMSAHSRMSDE